MMQRDTKHKDEWDAGGWVGPQMERKQRTSKRSRHGVAMTGGSGDGPRAEVCWAKGKCRVHRPGLCEHRPEIDGVWGTRRVDSTLW
jgi:hypothetical protein